MFVIANLLILMYYFTMNHAPVSTFGVTHYLFSYTQPEVAHITSTSIYPQFWAKQVGIMPPTGTREHNKYTCNACWCSRF